MVRNQVHSRTGMSPIEVLVIIAIVATLGGLGLGTVQRTRHTAALKETDNRLKEVVLSLHKCHDVHKRFPPAWGAFPPRAPWHDPPPVRATLHYWLLPYVKADATYERGQPAATGGTSRNVWTNPDAYGLVVEAYFSPADYTAGAGTVALDGPYPWGAACFAGNARVFGGLKKNATSTTWDNKARMATLADGSSNVIAFATRLAQCGQRPGGSAWAGGSMTACFDNFMMSGGFFASDVEDTPTFNGGGYKRNPPFQVVPEPTACEPHVAHGYSSAGIQIALFDGSVRTVEPSIGSKIWGEACHPSDGMNFVSEWSR